MLTSLQVKNIALIDSEEINFGEGLNILTGETGAGKSIILGALDLALGGKVHAGSLRDADNDGYAEAVFEVKKESEIAQLSASDVEVYDDSVILSRRITPQRTTARINGESLPAVRLKEAGEILINIHGQNEHQSLLKKSEHLRYLDKYAAPDITPLKEKMSKLYEEYSKLLKEYEDSSCDESSRAREISFLEHEINEIREASLVPGEDETLEEEFKKLSHGEKIREALAEAYRNIGTDGASDEIGRALYALRSVESYDESLSDLTSMLCDAESIIGDLNREISSYMDAADNDGERLAEAGSRLDKINDLKNKYGRTINDILEELDKKQERLDKLNDYDTYLKDLKSNLDKTASDLKSISDEVSSIRKAASIKLCNEIKNALNDLNFLDVVLEMSFTDLDHFTANGTDEAEFMISLNPGSPVLPLREVASGGELSRIMLALKTVMADADDIDTLIFDEIDAGISGRTAQAVAEKLSDLSRSHQIICITHLPQIAAMADHHYLIEKNVNDGNTISSIHEITGSDITNELARMLGGAEITDAVIKSAEEMKKLADQHKSRIMAAYQ